VIPSDSPLIPARPTSYTFRTWDVWALRLLLMQVSAFAEESPVDRHSPGKQVTIARQADCTPASPRTVSRYKLQHRRRETGFLSGSSLTCQGLQQKGGDR